MSEPVYVPAEAADASIVTVVAALPPAGTSISCVPRVTMPGGAGSLSGPAMAASRERVTGCVPSLRKVTVRTTALVSPAGIRADTLPGAVHTCWVTARATSIRPAP
ncbi:hypothetical protein ACWDSD_34890 [Streptomyces spiralis]